MPLDYITFSETKRKNDLTGQQEVHEGKRNELERDFDQRSVVWFVNLETEYDETTDAND